MSLATVYFIDTYLGNSAQVPVFQAPFDNPLDRSKNLARTRAETFGGLTPIQTACPIRKKLTHLHRLCMLTFAPRNLFRNDTMFGTSDATHGVGKEKRNVPKRNKFEKSWSRASVISWTATLAFGTDALGILAWNNLGYQTGGLVLVVNVNIAENEGLVIGNKIQYSLYEHLGERVKERIIAKIFYLFPDRDVL